VNTLFKIFIIMLVITGVSAILINVFHVEYGTINFWQNHGVIFLICIALFPRLTMIFATPWGGLIWWLGLLFVPRLQVAILATICYWNTNKILVIMAWLVALGGESTEKYYIQKRTIWVNIRGPRDRLPM